MPAPHQSIFYRSHALASSNQQCQSTNDLGGLLVHSVLASSTLCAAVHAAYVSHYSHIRKHTNEICRVVGQVIGQIQSPEETSSAVAGMANHGVERAINKQYRKADLN